MTRFQILTVGVVLGLSWLVGLLIYYSFLPGWRSLDFLMTTGQIERALARWTPEDIAHHVHGTRVWDTIFPALYGVVIIAVVLRYWSGWQRGALIALTLVAVVADYWENALNLKLLAGQGSINAHLWATWIKFIAITLPMDLGLIRWMRELRS